MARLKTKKPALGRSTIKASRLRSKPDSELSTTTGPVTAMEPGESGGPVVGDAGTGEPLSNELEILVEQIKEAHNDALNHATGVVGSAAEAGEKLLEAKSKLEEGMNFTKWVEANLPMKGRTAYSYVRVFEAKSRHALDISGAQSIREVLKMVSEAEGKKPRDPKVETWVSAVAKVEAFFEEEIGKLPIDDWSEEDRKTRKNLLKNLAAIHRKL